MKSKRRKRIIAVMLCMVLAFSTGISTIAEAEPETTPATVAAEPETKEAAVQSAEADAQTQETQTQQETTSEPQTQEEPQTAEESGQTETAQAEQEQQKTQTEDATQTEEVQTQEETAGQKTETQGKTAAETKEASEEQGGETADEEEETEGSPAFSTSVEAEDKSAIVHISAEEGVFPEGTTAAAKRIDSSNEEYSQVEKSLENETAKSNKDVLDFVAYDITFRDAEGNEIEPEGEVQVSLDFHDMELGGASKEDSTVSVIHVKDDFSTETVQSDVDLTGDQLKQVEFKADEFSIYAVTAGGIVETYSNEIQAGDYVSIEFWDKETKEGTQEIKFRKTNQLDQNDRGVHIRVYIDDQSVLDEKYEITEPESSAFENGQINMQTTVRPGENYWLKQACTWQKANEDTTSTFGGSGSTGPNKAGNAGEWNVLTIYLTAKKPNKSCTQEAQGENGTKDILVDLYNYNTDNYNNYVGLNRNSLLLRSAWGNYKADNYKFDAGAWNISCGKTGIYYGLASMQNGNINFTQNAAFFDTAFDTANNSQNIGTKYPDVKFKFLYDESTNEYSYNSGSNHVHFEESTNTITQYSNAGPNTLSDGTDFQKSGFFPFTDENDNMTDYGFGMRMDVDFLLTSNGTLDGKENGTPMTFHFSGDDDVWVFIDGKLVLDLGGLHSRRGGTINFKTGEVSYDKVTNDQGTEVEPTAVEGGGQRPDTDFLTKLQPGTHKLTMYYLERGGNDSNCEIKFNLLVVTRAGTLDFDKVDEGNNPLGNAEFGLYSSNEITDETIPLLKANSNDDGKVSFDISDLDVGTYYLKEISAPFGYVIDDNIYLVSVSEDKTNPTEIIVQGKITGLKNNQVINKKYVSTGGTTSVSVKKVWTDNLKPKPVSVSLWANDKKLEGNEYTVILDKNNNWSKTWDNLPGDTVYEVKENDIPNGIEVTTDEEVSYTVSGKPYTIKPCNELSYTAGENSVVLIKSGSLYHVWTPVPINESEKSGFFNVLNQIKDGGNAVEQSNTTFYSGASAQLGFVSAADIKLSFDSTNHRVSVDYVASNAWSWFSIGNYNKDEKITLTNGIDKKTTINIPVIKEWKGDPEQTDNYNYVTVQLYQNGKIYENPVKIRKEEGWTYIFTDLPCYSTNENGEVIVNNYMIKETEFGRDESKPFKVEDCKDWLKVEISENQDGGYTITNAIPDQWVIYKVSSTDHTKPLEGAEFTLTKKGASEPSYYGKSFNPDGVIKWWDKYGSVGNEELETPYISDGEYILEEIKAPVGYSKNEMKWEITIKNLILTEIKDSNGPVRDQGKINRASEQTKIYLYENTPLYELPSAGGPGIFLYTIGGILLLMAGSLILYKMKRGEVLKK